MAEENSLLPVVQELRKQNRTTNELLKQKFLDDTPKQIIAQALPEVFAEYDANKNLGKDIKKELDEGDKIVRTELGFLADISLRSFKVTSTYFAEMMNFAQQLLSRDKKNPIMGLTRDFKEMSAKATTGAFIRGIQEYTDELEKSFTNIESERREFDERTDKKGTAKAKEEAKEQRVADDNRFTKLSRGFTKGFKTMGEKFDKLTSGIVGKVGLVTILTVLVVAFAKNFKPFGLFVVAALDVIRRFVSDLSMVLTGEMGFGEFLKNNLVAIAGGFIFLFRNFIIKKLFGGLVTKIGAAIRLVGQTAGSKLALAGKIFLKLLTRFFLIPMVIFKAISGFFQGYQKKILEGGTFLEALGAGLKGAIMNVFDFIVDGIMMVVNALTGIFKSIVNAIDGGIMSAVKFFKGLISGDDVEGRFMGGPVVAGSPYVVGERGPELFVPGAAGGIVPGLGGGAVVVNNNQINQANSTSNHNHSSISVTDRQQERVGL